MKVRPSSNEACWEMGVLAAAATGSREKRREELVGAEPQKVHY